MPLGDLLIDRVLGVLNEPFQLRQGRIVPDATDVALQNGAVQIPSTFLFSDLASSTDLATRFPADVAAKVVRCFLETATRAIQSQKGRLRSFDGDRVMGVFFGPDANQRAVHAGMLISGLMDSLMRPMISQKYPVLAASGFEISHCTGIDSGQVMAVKVGTRLSNDLVWIGRAPNVAAKLSSDRSGLGTTAVTSNVISTLSHDMLFDINGIARWVNATRQGPAGVEQIYFTHQCVMECMSIGTSRRLERILLNWQKKGVRFI